MSPRPGDRLIVAFVEAPPRSSFVSWPLHVTLMPWFASKLTDEQLRQVVQHALQGATPFQAELGEEAYFGHNPHVPVRVVATPNGFVDLHERILRAFTDNPHIKLLVTEHIGTEFRAHITQHHDANLPAGEHIFCDRIHIVELAKIQAGGALKTIKTEVDLHD